MFSGLNLAFFSITKLKLEIESKNNNLDAIKIAKLREDSNFLLTTDHTLYNKMITDFKDVDQTASSNFPIA